MLLVEKRTLYFLFLEHLPHFVMMRRSRTGLDGRRLRSSVLLPFNTLIRGAGLFISCSFRTSQAPKKFTYAFSSLQAHDSQAPWSPPSAYADPSLNPFPLATKVTILQLGHVCLLLALTNIFVLTTARLHLAHLPRVQEVVLRSYLAPLLIGDVAHIVLTLWALDQNVRWDVANWGLVLWSTVGLGITLLIPRVLWHAGVGRYVDRRDGDFMKVPTPEERAKEWSRSGKEDAKMLAERELGARGLFIVEKQ